MATEFSREFFADNRIVKAELRSARKPREEELNRVQEAFRTYDAVGYSRGISAAYHYQDVAAYLKGLSE